MRTRWLAVAGAGVAIITLVGVVGPTLVRSPERSAVALAADPVTSMVTTTTVDTIPATVPTIPTATIDPATTIPAATSPPGRPLPSPPLRPPPGRPRSAPKPLALITYPWTKLGYTLTFHGPKAGFFGLTDCHTHNIDIYVTSSQTVVQVAYITAFEIGHAIDCAHLADGHQTTWPALRGYHLTGSWFPSCSCSEDHFSSGDFSEVFARWQVGPAYAWRSALAPAPTAAQIAALIPQFG